MFRIGDPEKKSSRILGVKSIGSRNRIRNTAWCKIAVEPELINFLFRKRTDYWDSSTRIQTLASITR
jgi:hypothetical protein